MADSLMGESLAKGGRRSMTSLRFRSLEGRDGESSEGRAWINPRGQPQRKPSEQNQAPKMADQGEKSGVVMRRSVEGSLASDQSSINPELLCLAQIVIFKSGKREGALKPKGEGEEGEGGEETIMEFISEITKRGDKYFCSVEPKAQAEEREPDEVPEFSLFGMNRSDSSLCLWPTMIRVSTATLGEREKGIKVRWESEGTKPETWREVAGEERIEKNLERIEELNELAAQVQRRYHWNKDAREIEGFERLAKEGDELSENVIAVNTFTSIDIERDDKGGRRKLADFTEGDDKAEVDFMRKTVLRQIKLLRKVESSRPARSGEGHVILLREEGRLEGIGEVMTEIVVGEERAMRKRKDLIMRREDGLIVRAVDPEREKYKKDRADDEKEEKEERRREVGTPYPDPVEWPEMKRNLIKDEPSTLNQTPEVAGQGEKADLAASEPIGETAINLEEIGRSRRASQDPGTDEQLDLKERIHEESFETSGAPQETSETPESPDSLSTSRSWIKEDAAVNSSVRES